MEYTAKGAMINRNMQVAEDVTGFHLEVTIGSLLGTNAVLDLK